VLDNGQKSSVLQESSQSSRGVFSLFLFGKSKREMAANRDGSISMLVFSDMTDLMRQGVDPAESKQILLSGLPAFHHLHSGGDLSLTP